METFNLSKMSFTKRQSRTHTHTYTRVHVGMIVIVKVKFHNVMSFMHALSKPLFINCALLKDHACTCTYVYYASCIYNDFRVLHPR